MQSCIALINFGTPVKFAMHLSDPARYGTCIRLSEIILELKVLIGLLHATYHANSEHFRPSYISGINDIVFSKSIWAISNAYPFDIVVYHNVTYQLF